MKSIHALMTVNYDRNALFSGSKMTDYFPFHANSLFSMGPKSL